LQGGSGRAALWSARIDLALGFAFVAIAFIAMTSHVEPLRSELARANELQRRELMKVLFLVLVALSWFIAFRIQRRDTRVRLWWQALPLIVLTIMVSYFAWWWRW